MEVASLRRQQWTLLSLKPAKLDAACAEAKTAARHSSQAFHGASSERESLPAELHFAVELQVQNLESCVTRIGTHPSPILKCSLAPCSAARHTWQCAVRWAGIDLMNKYNYTLNFCEIHIYAVFPIYVTCCVCCAPESTHTPYHDESSVSPVCLRDPLCM